MQILLVEDNPGDVRLTREALREGSLATNLEVAEDGVAALAYLRREGAYATADRPDMILLDLNLPRKHGREVLSEIKADVNLRRIPVVILSSSGAEEDIRGSYDLHANCYVRKPSDYEAYVAAVHSIEDFWLRTARLPAD